MDYNSIKERTEKSILATEATGGLHQSEVNSVSLLDLPKYSERFRNRTVKSDWLSSISMCPKTGKLVGVNGSTKYTRTGFHQLWAAMGGSDSGVFLKASTATRAFAFNELALENKSGTDKVIRFGKSTGVVDWYIRSVVSVKHSLEFLDDVEVFSAYSRASEKLTDSPIGLITIHDDYSTASNWSKKEFETLGGLKLIAGTRCTNSETGKSSLRISSCISVSEPNIPSCTIGYIRKSGLSRVRHIIAGTTPEERKKSAHDKITAATDEAFVDSALLVAMFKEKLNRQSLPAWNDAYGPDGLEVFVDAIEETFGLGDCPRASVEKAIEERKNSCIQRYSDASIALIIAAAGDSLHAGSIIMR